MATKKMKVSKILMRRTAKEENKMIRMTRMKTTGMTSQFYLDFSKNPRIPSSFSVTSSPAKPAWLDPLNLPSEKSRVCGFCGEPLQFLLQVYAPLSDKEIAFHRTLYVFLCPSMACLLRDQHEQWKRRVDNPSRSVRVFRCQLPLSNPFYPGEPPLRDGSAKPSGHGAALCSWCGTWKGEKLCSSCRRARYCSEKHQILHWRSGHKVECRQFISLQSDDFILNRLNEKMAEERKFASSMLWPEYEITIDDEYVPDDETSGPNGSHLSLVTKSEDSNDVFQSLFNKFEMDSDKRAWASFQERMVHNPAQVLRYLRDTRAKPLWPLPSGRPSESDIPKCCYCGGSLCYEFQILPQLLYYFNVKNETGSLDWATIAVYSCSDSCEAGNGYKEEFAWVQLQTGSV
ncbi:zinc finger (MYND type) family protein / programmed cell death 2 C-terminal domain-containing protein isoform X2 [Wolffia australiana]